MSKKRVFYESWLKDYDYSAWLEKHASKHKVRCKICPKDIELGNIGALKSPAGGAKHKSKLKARECHTFFHYSTIIVFVFVSASITRAHTSDRYNTVSLLDFSHFVLGYFQRKLVYKYIGVYTNK